MQGLRVAIVGGGIGGLTSAIALRRFGHHPVVVEQAAELRAIGAGISLWPNGVKVLNLLGLGPEIAALGGAMEQMAYADRSGRVLLELSLSELYERVGERARPVERAALQQLLLEAAGEGTVVLGTRAVEVRKRHGGVVVVTDDDGELEADLVVAADGTHSALREAVVGEAVQRCYVGYVNWNGLVEQHLDLAPPSTWLTFVGEGKRVSLMPVGRRRCYVFFDVPMPLAEALALPPAREAREVLAQCFKGWAPAVQALIGRLDPEGLACIPIHDTPPLQRWQRDRVVLLGDAAHTMAPDLGQGGCQAMEDAWVLTHHLSATSRGVEDALARYERERMPHTASMLRRARRRAETTHGADPQATAAWYEALATGAYGEILDGLAQSVETGPCR